VSNNLQVAIRLGVALAPAMDASIRVDFDKAEVLAPARVYYEGVNIGHFQGKISL
jgi:hypothetical protein